MARTTLESVSPWWWNGVLSVLDDSAFLFSVEYNPSATLTYFLVDSFDDNKQNLWRLYT